MKVNTRFRSRSTHLYSFNRKGVTLIELIIVLAIIGIIINIAFSMNLFGAKTFAKGSDRYDLNTKTNLVSEYITKNIRYAYGVEILSSSYIIPSSTDIASSNPNDAYIFISSDSGKSFINYRDKNDTKILGEFDSCLFEVKAGDSVDDYESTLTYTINTTIKNETFSVDSGIVPINLLIQNNHEIVDNTGIEKGVALKLNKVIPVTVPVGTLTFNIGTPGEGEVGQSYPAYTFFASGGNTPYNYTISEATKLPYGMKLSPTGTLSGTPEEAGDFTFVVEVNDSSTPEKIGSKYYNIIIKDTVVVDTDAPKVTNVNITGDESILQNRTVVVAIPLTATFDYYVEGYPNASFNFTWLRGNNADGTGLAEIAGATANTYTTVSSDVNQFIYVKVTPKATAGSTTQGTTVFCNFPVKIMPSGTSTTPTVSNVYITGAKDKGEWTLTGNYTYDSGSEGHSTFKWYRSKKVGDPKELIGGKEAITYIITDNDYKVYYFEVTPKSSDNVLGEPVMSDNFTTN